ncbi:MAG: NAD(+)/NADH kinase [Candidatus Aenigmarchaeota archaeon]|nr:NAD(+)/NADH kinase [Candidatus Aenigmarchaeota archaeon]
MKVAIVSQNNYKLIKQIKSAGLRIVKVQPDIVISIGGDGTILLSERLYPSVPKLAIKTSSTCRKCQYMPGHLKVALELIKKGKYRIVEEKKIEAKFKNHRLIALNEIQLHNKKPTVAIRFSVQANGFKQDNVIGDGLIVSTPFGSTGYYMSITGKKFKKGIGLAFNNPHNIKTKGIVLDENKKINIKLLREEAWLIRDNDDNFLSLKKNDRFKVFVSKEKAHFIKF